MKRALFLFGLAFLICATVTVLCVKFLVYVDGKKNGSVSSLTVIQDFRLREILKIPLYSWDKE